ncbi:rCG56771, isoform CRA_a [Rattus norvegicus]|uniref:RCG56771, isoform CRA_a n=1 Tax=Rattus norvegicus TaxID=10116 RepID=A6KJJ9_RAT|nr:rCG56771, isoform CRA_a [Rattus norvegicus]
MNTLYPPCMEYIPSNNLGNLLLLLWAVLSRLSLSLCREPSKELDARDWGVTGRHLKIHYIF